MKTLILNIFGSLIMFGLNTCTNHSDEDTPLMDTKRKLRMKKLALFSFVIIVIGCSNDNSNVDSVCTYEGVELDTNQIVVIREQDLVGEWKLQFFVDLLDCSIENEPVNFPRPLVVISFEDSLQLSGHTTNEFYGNYFLVRGKIEMSVSFLTEINENKWTRKFLEAARNTDYIFIEDSKLFIFFNQSSNVMVFMK